MLSAAPSQGPTGYVAGSPLLWMLPAMCAFVALAFAYLNVFVIGVERRVRDLGEHAEAQVVRLWQEEDRRSKSTKRTLSYVQLAWRGKDGTAMEFDKLPIAGETYAALKAAQASGVATTPISYDTADKDIPPFLIADGEPRAAQWALMRKLMWGFAFMTACLAAILWMFRTGYRLKP